MAQITVTGGTLFEIAATYLGDINQWSAIAALNAIRDPWLVGVNVIELPSDAATAGGQSDGQ